MKRKTRGQTAILVVLIGTVVATMGLATVARTVTNVQISFKIENAHVAMQAAEAGAAYGLSPYVAPGNGACNITTLTDVLVQPCNVTGIGSVVNEPVAIGIVKKGEARTIWLVSHDANENPHLAESPLANLVALDLTWENGSLELIQIYRESGAFKLTKHYYNSASTLSLSFPSGSLVIALRVKPIAEDTNISFTPRTASFPSQGRMVDSTGVTQNSNITRRIVVTRWYPELPAIFDYVLFSYGSLEKN